MKRFLLVLSSFFFIFYFQTQIFCVDYKFDLDSNWTYYYPMEKIPMRYSMIDFLDTLQGIAGFNFMNGAIFQGRIMMTKDGGLTWKIVFDDKTTYKIDSITGRQVIDHKAQQIHDIVYVDTNLIVAIFCDVNSFDYTPYFTVSNDNGDNWNKFYLNKGIMYEDISFYSNTLGLILPLTNKSDNKILISYDKARNWYEFDYDITSLKYPIDVHCFSDSTIMFFTRTYFDEMNSILSNFYIRKTTDLGRTWEVNKCPDSLYGQKEINFLNENEGWLGGYILPKDSTKEFLQLRIYKTIDGGRNWELQFDTISGNKNNFMACRVKFYDNKNGFFIGSNNDIFLTTDGGENWIKQVKADVRSKEFHPINLIDAEYLTKDKIIALSEYGYIFKYERKTSTDIDDERHNNDNIISFSPNPAIETITLKIDIKTQTKTYIKIFNLLGIKQAEFNFELSSSENSIPIDISNLSSGVYYVIINDGFEFQKAMFVKE